LNLGQLLHMAARLAAALFAMAGSLAHAQTTGDSNAGQQLFSTTLSPQCSGCHSTTNASAANSLTAIRNAITSRAQPGGAAGTMNFAKALEALNAALNGNTLGDCRAEVLGVIVNGVRASAGGYFKRNIQATHEYQSAQS
jgi:cytochrome c2